jgi:hypothetical protein
MSDAALPFAFHTLPRAPKPYGKRAAATEAPEKYEEYYAERNRKNGHDSHESALVPCETKDA